MTTAFMTVKGGSGCTIMACGYAVFTATEYGKPVLLVDWGGDVPAALGLPQPAEPDYGPDYGPASAGDNLYIASADWFLTDPDLSDFSEVVHDIGVVTDKRQLSGELEPALAGADKILVTHPCYLAVRRAVAMDIKVDGFVLNNQPGRALTAHDVSRAINAPCRTEVMYEMTIARSVDAGLLAVRMPVALRRAARQLKTAPAEVAVSE